MTLLDFVFQNLAICRKTTKRAHGSAGGVLAKIIKRKLYNFGTKTLFLHSFKISEIISKISEK